MSVDTAAHQSAGGLDRSHDEDRTSVTYAAFGGQGISKNPFQELRSFHELHRDVVSGFMSHCSNALVELEGFANSKHRPRLDLLSWLSDTKPAPDQTEVLPPRISMPLIGVLQLCAYFAFCTCLQMTPGQFNRALADMAGHSQGIVTAAFVSSADSWESFYECSTKALTVLYHIGASTEQTWPTKSPLDHRAVSDCIKAGQGMPSPMLSVAGLNRELLDEELNSINRTVVLDSHAYVALRNGRETFVVAGKVETLYTLRTCLQDKFTSAELTRTIFDRRPPTCTLQFLPVAAPFHSPLLRTAAQLSKEKSRSIHLSKDHLIAGVAQLRHTEHDDLVPALIDSVLQLQHDWCAAMNVWRRPGEVVDFGPGGSDGIGKLVQQVKRGSGLSVRILRPPIAEGTIRGSSSCPIEAVTEVAGSDKDWCAVFAPRLHSIGDGQARIRTRFTEVLGLPPLMVAGMTPTTCAPDFVAAIMRDGFHAELATGGFTNATSLRQAVTELAEAMPDGRLITLNIVYASPQRVRWQIPLVSALVKEGYPIGGLTFGAGVPSLEVATEFIESLGLSHISFKPGSVSAIQDVLEIARQHPTFPVILQWTGGRGGGHHSYEDFHLPIFKTYSAIRECDNVVLVAGSGFGDVEGSWPYLSGQWSADANGSASSRMPFDAILIGTCAMTTLEAKTSREVKEMIVNTPGVPDDLWTGTMEAATGGVITIVSEMGEPMHVIANRGMLLWAELDRSIFSLPKAQQLAVLRSKRSYIIARLNNDFHKVWFGLDTASGQPVELSDMTYMQVLRRLLELVRPTRGGPWAHESYRETFDDFLLRTQERLGTVRVVNGGTDSWSQLAQLNRALPCSTTELVVFEDVHYFIDLCKRPGRKPAPFIPVLDEDFETWFKKDSLWQSENLAAMHHRDAGRICILSGPVAVKHATAVDVPVGKYLNTLLHGYIGKVSGASEQHDRARPRSTPSSLSLPGLTVQGRQFAIDENSDELPDNEKWLSLLGSELGPWGRQLFVTRVLTCASRMHENPVRKIFAARRGLLVRFEGEGSDACAELCSLQSLSSPEAMLSYDGATITLRLLHSSSIDGVGAHLSLHFELNELRPFAPIKELVADRNERIRGFYHALWFGGNVPRLRGSATSAFEFPEEDISADSVQRYNRAVDGLGPGWSQYLDSSGAVPVEFSVVLAWQALMQPLFLLDCDLSRLLHTSYECKSLRGEKSLLIGDKVMAKSAIRNIENSAAGARVSIRAAIWKSSEAIIEVESEFLLIRQQLPERCCPQQDNRRTRKVVLLRTEADVCALLAKPWYKRDPQSEPLRVGGRLLVELDESELSRLGTVYLQNEGKENRCGSIEISGSSAFLDSVNSVKRYLERVGEDLDRPTKLDREIDVLATQTAPTSIKLAEDSREYAIASKDFNPIHTSQTFARFAGLQTTIYHGMQTTALVLHLVRQHLPARISAFQCTFLSKALPGEELKVGLKHVAMHVGNKILAVKLTRQSSGEAVMEGEVTVASPRMALLFTGQGNQFGGMGMELKAQNASCRKVWSDADAYFEATWGFRLTDAVAHNPKQLTVNFGGLLGMSIRDNYTAIQKVFADTDASDCALPFQGLHGHSRSYTFEASDGLLSMTQFAQPAICVLETAAFELLRSQNKISADFIFAGHSLGEFAALSCGTSFLPFRSLMRLAFVRGTIMQTAVPRARDGCSDFAMVALRPRRVHLGLCETHVSFIVDRIATESGLLLEVVNRNVRGDQYVCAGDKRCLDVLQRLTDDIHNDQTLLESTTRLTAQIDECLRGLPESTNIKLRRGHGTAPLQGIDVPFHSSMLLPHKGRCRHALLKAIQPGDVKPDVLERRWTPNVTGKPFAVREGYLRLVLGITGSPELRALATKLGIVQ